MYTNRTANRTFLELLQIRIFQPDDVILQDVAMITHVKGMFSFTIR